MILEFFRVWVFLGLVAVPSDDNVDGDADQDLHRGHQAGGQDGETPGGGDQCSRREEVVDSGEREDEATEVEDEGREMSVEGNVGGRERIEDGSRGRNQNHEDNGRHEHRQDGDSACSPG